jgi:hypothetical protein
MSVSTNVDKINNWNENNKRFKHGEEKAKEAFRGGWCWAYAHAFSKIKKIQTYWISPSLMSSYLVAHAYSADDARYFDSRYPSGTDHITFFGKNDQTGETELLWEIKKMCKHPIGEKISEAELKQRFSLIFPEELWETTLDIAGKYIRSTMQSEPPQG